MPVWWFAAAALAAVPVGLTYSRTALGGLVIGCLALAIGGRSRPRAHAAAIVALLVGAGSRLTAPRCTRSIPRSA